MRGQEDRSGACRLRAEAVDRPELDDFLAHGLHDTPAARKRPEGDGSFYGLISVFLLESQEAAHERDTWRCEKSSARL